MNSRPTSQAEAKIAEPEDKTAVRTELAPYAYSAAVRVAVPAAAAFNTEMARRGTLRIYNNLNDSFIIFICTFDAIGKNKPVYTFENLCIEDKNTSLQDGTKKVIINSEAFKDAKDKELKEFLEYLKTGKAKSEFTRRIEEMIQTVKQNEQARQEYKLMGTFEMDAIEKGIYRKAIETAKLMKQKNFDIALIKEITGLPEMEIEKL